jgi:regulator of sigma E protease
MILYLIEAAVAFVVAISILIAVHEFGHFSVARALGFKVLRFSIGFGRPLLKHTGRDNVEYVLAAIPLGGYVKMADEREAAVAPSDLPRAFNRRPVWQRVLVLLAGPGANFVFAVIAYWLLYVAGIPGLKPVIAEVTPNSYVAHAGLKSGDELIRVGDRAVGTQEAAVLAILSAVVDGPRVDLTVRRDGAERALSVEIPQDQRRALTEPGSGLKGLGFSFPAPHIVPLVNKVVPNGSAARAGVKAGDTIEGIDGNPISEWTSSVDYIRAHAGRTITLDIRRGDSHLHLPVGVVAERESDRPNAPMVGRIGVVAGKPEWPPGLTTVERYPILAAGGPALRQTWYMTRLTVRFLGGMLTGQVSVKNVSGPIAIANYAGATALEGINAFLNFLALISISLGVLNLLPIPILDGGQLVYQLAEGIRRRPLSPRVQALGQQVGIVVLILLMSLAFYNDIARHFS